MGRRSADVVRAVVHDRAAQRRGIRRAHAGSWRLHSPARHALPTAVADRAAAASSIVAGGIVREWLRGSLLAQN